MATATNEPRVLPSNQILPSLGEMHYVMRGNGQLAEFLHPGGERKREAYHFSNETIAELELDEALRAAEHGACFEESLVDIAAQVHHAREKKLRFAQR